ncbi:ABC transporter substrate-binding protein [Homoserinibacter sp. YIM 151385]|uniref:ABC transporter substrate-binding protein n=1 Tax=Homoserinibacter sp. YIM 151385 TaxID=2985506 RepID=UPI0022F02CE7|nr:ABC transporter substrate-binding protein [Homoserinibacter sp. YIM 151385]WBU37948.1 ABC transporter substrate-binding protein [Homoserinibacter sp. YIM 151385]
MSRNSRRRAAGAVALAAATAIALAGCGGGADRGGGLTEEGFIQKLEYGGFGGGDNPQVNYNPFLVPTRLAAWEYLYEPLMETNDYTCEATPWLATDFSWNEDGTQLTYEMREGPTWTDGEALDGEDVKFTFELLRDNEALDVDGVWRYLDSVEAPDPGTVVFTFTGPGASAFTLVNNVRIVPEHIWKDVEDPVTFTNEEPVSSGPMTVKSFTPQALVIERNPDFWGAEDVKVQEIQFNKSDAGQVEQLKLSRGDYDANAMFVPNIEEVYVDKDPENNHYWFASGSPISLFMNLEQAPFDDVAFRKAIALGIDRERIVEEAQYGYVEPASQTGLVLPGMEEWLPEGLEGDASYIAYDADAAAEALDAAGYGTDGSGKRLDKTGQPMEFSFKVPGGYNDWIQAAQVMQDDFEALGITIDLQTPTPETVESDRSLGEYEMTFGVRGGTCNMFRNFQEPLASDQTAPTGEKAATNEIRWRDDRTDQLVEELRVAVGEEDQRAAVGELSQIMMDEVPYVPIWYGANWFQYSTKQATGWPNEDDPYAKYADSLLVLTHLQPTGSEG